MIATAIPITNVKKNNPTIPPKILPSWPAARVVMANLIIRSLEPNLPTRDIKILESEKQRIGIPARIETVKLFILK